MMKLTSDMQRLLEQAKDQHGQSLDLKAMDKPMLLIFLRHLG